MTTTYTSHKTLTLIRHGDAQPPGAGTTDYDRALTPYGEQQARQLGEKLKACNLSFHAIYASPAARAQSTAHLIATCLALKPDNIILDIRLYTETSRQLLNQLILNFEAKHTHIAIVGHNPIITELAETMSGKNLSAIPTCGCIQIHFNVTHWHQCADRTTTTA